jgi:enoyl-CoA hydratase/carnithine racemase
MTDGSTPEVLVKDHGAVRLIRLQRPSAKNALTPEVIDVLSGAFAAAAEDPAVRALVLAGVPGAFCSGADVRIIAQAMEGGSAAISEVLDRFQALTLGVVKLAKPVVAAVTGAAIGIGTTMLLHCDFDFVSDEARLAMPFVALGLVPEFASSVVLPQLIGKRRAA